MQPVRSRRRNLSTAAGSSHPGADEIAHADQLFQLNKLARLEHNAFSTQKQFSANAAQVSCGQLTGAARQTNWQFLRKSRTVERGLNVPHNLHWRSRNDSKAFQLVGTLLDMIEPEAWFHEQIQVFHHSEELVAEAVYDSGSSW
ncbi:MAG: hypothetical protein ACLRZ5_11705 [Ruminococcus sp.]